MWFFTGSQRAVRRSRFLMWLTARCNFHRIALDCFSLTCYSLWKKKKWFWRIWELNPRLRLGLPVHVYAKSVAFLSFLLMVGRQESCRGAQKKSRRMPLVFFRKCSTCRKGAVVVCCHTSFGPLCTFQSCYCICVDSSSARNSSFTFFISSAHSFCLMLWFSL